METLDFVHLQDVPNGILGQQDRDLDFQEFQKNSVDRLYAAWNNDHRHPICSPGLKIVQCNYIKERQRGMLTKNVFLLTRPVLHDSVSSNSSILLTAQTWPQEVTFVCFETWSPTCVDAALRMMRSLQRLLKPCWTSNGITSDDRHHQLEGQMKQVYIEVIPDHIEKWSNWLFAFLTPCFLKLFIVPHISKITHTPKVTSAHQQMFNRFQIHIIR